jgi:hypothetical protein
MSEFVVKIDCFITNTNHANDTNLRKSDKNVIQQESCIEITKLLCVFAFNCVICVQKMNLQRYELQNELTSEMVRIKYKKPETPSGVSGSGIMCVLIIVSAC